MATSSILEHIKLDDPKAVERFVDAMEASEYKPVCSANVRTDEKRISDTQVRTFVSKAQQNRRSIKD